MKPSLHGPGYDCEPAFGLKYDNDSPARVIDFADIEVAKSEELSLDTLLLCNKTSSGPGFHKTEIQALNTKILRLGSGECEEFEDEGFRCIEHYECIGDDVSLVTDGDSQTRLVFYIV